MTRSSAITASTTSTHAGKSRLLKSPHPRRLTDQRQADRGGREEEPQDERVDDDDAEIVRPTPTASDLLAAPRRDEFPGRHGREHAGEGREADQRFGGEQSVHGFSPWAGQRRPRPPAQGKAGDQRGDANRKGSAATLTPCQPKRCSRPPEANEAITTTPTMRKSLRPCTLPFSLGR